MPSPSEIFRNDEEGNTKPSNPKDAVGSRKVGLSNLPMPPLFEAAAALTEGSLKYGRHNYRDVGVRASVYFDAAFRHLGAWWEGEDVDPDSGISHVTKAIAGLLVLRDSMLTDNWTDDRPPRPEQGFIADMNEVVGDLIDARPDPVPPFTELSGERELGYGAPDSYVVEVSLPDGAGERWVELVSDIPTAPKAQAIAEDYYQSEYARDRAVRVVGVCPVFERSRNGVTRATGEVTTEIHSLLFPESD